MPCPHCLGNDGWHAAGCPKSTPPSPAEAPADVREVARLRSALEPFADAWRKRCGSGCDESAHSAKQFVGADEFKVAFDAIEGSQPTEDWVYVPRPGMLARQEALQKISAMPHYRASDLANPEYAKSLLERYEHALALAEEALNGTA